MSSSVTEVTRIHSNRGLTLVTLVEMPIGYHVEVKGVCANDIMMFPRYCATYDEAIDSYYELVQDAIRIIGPTAHITKHKENSR